MLSLAGDALNCGPNMRFTREWACCDRIEAGIFEARRSIPPE